MFQCGQLVMYGAHGVCKITGTQERTIDRKKVEYFVLEPLDQENVQFYVPTHNQAAIAKLSPLLTKNELDALLLEESAADPEWIVDENRRKQRYRELIVSGDRASLVSMVRVLLKHKAQQQAAGRKFHLCDENFLKDAQKLLSAEFSLVLGIRPEEVGAYIEKTLEE